MWNRTIFGYDSYEVILWFLTYSMMGWFVESVYMSICNRRLTNRGFATGPFCPIYGVGALTAYFVLKPYSDSMWKLFLLGSILATTVEYITALIMNRIFGEIWWDYTEKPFNYKGILCLESSIAWGIYTLGLFTFLHKFVSGMVAGIPFETGRFFGSVTLIVFLMDFTNSLYKEKKEEIPEHIHEVKELIWNRLAR